MTRIIRSSDRAYRGIGLPGIEKAVLWRGGQGVIYEFFKLAKGVDYPEHTHDGWESMFVLDGRIRLSGEVMGPGDFVFTEPGETHIAEILEDSVVLLGFGKDYEPEPA
ncbi:MAG: cupin domain-containing protein [Rhodospirillaceae bacterium]|nr:cupin domain-containing protein [Rhodospirillaceae bacterium]